MKFKGYLPIVALLLSVAVYTGQAAAQGEDDLTSSPFAGLPKDSFYTAKITQIGEEYIENHNGVDLVYQNLEAEINSGPEKGSEITVRNGGGTVIPEHQKLEKGDRVIIGKNISMGETEYYIVDRYRLPPIWIISAGFFALVITFSRWKGIASIAGLAISILVLVKFIVPEILEGGNPLAISLIGSFIIAVFSIYTSHGLNKRTSVAVLSTLITLAISIVLSVIFVKFAQLFGTGNDEAFYLQMGQFENINLRGLLMAGIIIGSLGVLDDVTTTQVATVDEIKKANSRLRFVDLYKRGLSVGGEHITSLVNTLVLAYAGASLPLFLLFSTNKHQPYWVIINSEFIAEEIIRTLVGSTSLTLAVPISTLLAAYFFARRKS